MSREVYSYALRLLTRRNYFINEMRQALQKKFPDEELEGVVEQLIKDRYLDDERTLITYVRWKINEGYGPYYIKEKLWQKGAETSADRIYALIESEELDLEEMMRQVVRKYIKTRKKNKDTASFMRSAMSYMAYKGFATGESLKILKSEVSEYESDFFEGC